MFIFLNICEVQFYGRRVNLLKLKKKIEIRNYLRGQILVELKYSGVCRSQLMEVRGLRGKDKYLPHLLGHEGCGKVIAYWERCKKS